MGEKLRTVETVLVSHKINDESDTAIAVKMNEFLTSLGLELNSERPTETSLSMEFSAYDVATPFEELAELVENKFPGFDTEIDEEYDDGESSGLEHFAHTLSIFPTPLV